MRYSLRLTGCQHQALYEHLFPGDGNEAVCLLLCGRRLGPERHVLTVRQVIPIPYESCSSRTPDSVTWPTHMIDNMVAEAYGRRQAIVKVHSHPRDYRAFSPIDDYSDRMLFGSVSSLLDDGLPQCSVIMLQNGDMFGRMVADGVIGMSLANILVVGDDIRVWPLSTARDDPFALRHAQAFGRGTSGLLRDLSVAIVGCSGTGSVVVELLARLGIGRLVLVDPDVVEIRNLNRIVNSTMEDAYLHRPKVKVLASAIARMGLNQEVEVIHSNVIDKRAVQAVAECDIVFGCMDGIEGRHALNRIATFYTQPYFDVGVRLQADGHGGVSGIAAAVHYLQPGRSSLLSRGVYSMEQLEAEALLRTSPELYARQRKEGYIRGIIEDRPAVISINSLASAFAVQEFLARLHPFRNIGNDNFACVGINLCEMQVLPEGEDGLDEALSRHVGRGDVTPLLERPDLT